jgi:hypothetical protein
MFEPRYAANLLVTVAGADGRGNSFRQTSKIINISRRGGRISGMPSFASPGDIIKVGYQGKQADFLIVWVKREAGVAGICCLDGDKEIWGNEVSEAAVFARHTSPGRSTPQARPQSPTRSVCAARVQPESIVRLSGSTPAAAGTAGISNKPSAREVLAAKKEAFIRRLNGTPHTEPPQSFYGGATPASVIEVERAEDKASALSPAQAELSRIGAVVTAPDPEAVPEAPSRAGPKRLHAETSASSSFYGSSVSAPLLETLASGTSQVRSNGARSAAPQPPVQSLRPIQSSVPTEQAAPSAAAPRQTVSGAKRMESSCRPLEPLPPVHPRVLDVRQRRYPRYACSGGVTAWIRGSSSKLWGQLNVISLGGCYVDTNAPFPPQTELDLLIGALGIQVRVQGRVTSYDRQAGMGIMFTKMSPTDSAQLRRLLALAAAPS